MTAPVIESVDNITATSARLNVVGGDPDPDGVSVSYDVQVAIHDDFRFCAAPRWNAPSGQPVQAPGLNAGTTYYARVRNRFSSSVGQWGPVNGFTTLPGAERILAPSAIMTRPAAIVVPTPMLEIKFATPSLPGFPARNLLIDAPVAARTLGPDEDPDTCVIVFKTAGAPIDTIAVLMTNMPASATIEVWAAETELGLNSGPGVFAIAPRPFRASQALPGRPGYHAFVSLPAAWAGPWFAVRIQGAPTGGRVKHFEHLVAGLNLVTKNHSAEVSVSPQPMTTVERKRSGIVDRVEGIPMRRVEFELAVLREAQFEPCYQTLWRRENKPILVVPNTMEGSFLHDRIFYGDLSGGRVAQRGIFFTRGFSVVSMI